MKEINDPMSVPRFFAAALLLLSSGCTYTLHTQPQSLSVLMGDPFPLSVAVSDWADTEDDAVEITGKATDLAATLRKVGLFAKVDHIPHGQNPSGYDLIIKPSYSARVQSVTLTEFFPVCLYPIFLVCELGIPNHVYGHGNLNVSIRDADDRELVSYSESSKEDCSYSPSILNEFLMTSRCHQGISSALFTNVADAVVNDMVANRSFYAHLARKLHPESISGSAQGGAPAVSKNEFVEAIQAALAGAAQAKKAPAAAREPHSDIDSPDYAPLPQNPNKFALVIGISKYRDIPEARFAERDARAMKAHLMALGYPEENIITLTGDHATKSSLVDKIERWLPMNITPKSTLFVYYSGHGAPDPGSKQAYLVPWDGEPGDLVDTAFPLSQFYKDLNKLPAKRVLVALDSCFSGAGGRSVLAQGARPLVVQVSNDVPQDGKLLVFSASKGDQISGTLEKEGHGAFTYYFLKGLNGQAMSERRQGHVTAGSLYHYLAPMVAAAAHRQERDQNPQLLPRSDRDSSYELR